MMENKFRAKTLAGNIIYFDLYQVTAGFYDDEVFYAKGEPIRMGSEQRYTGKKDKNSAEIYEGDTLGYPVADDRGNYSAVATVEWEDDRARFVARFKDFPEHRLYPILPRTDYFNRYVVIGNIWENKELLE